MQVLVESRFDSTDGDDPLFSRIAQDLTDKGWSVLPNAVPGELSANLWQQLQSFDSNHFAPAGIGRSADHTLNQFVRRDDIRWIEGITEPEREWLAWTNRLRLYLNQRLFLGLFSFESHFARYGSGDFYKKHVDSFKSNPLRDTTNRVLSLVAYFNPGWLPDDGGELVLYDETGTEQILSVTPAFGTMVVFLSEDVPHEVKVTNRDRFSIAGWFRVNNSLNNQLDPPR